VKLLFFFLDGVGLGEDNPEINPFVRTLMPNLEKLLGGHKMIADDHRYSDKSDCYIANTKRASLMALDACFGVDGLPQSASGQAALVTGVNIPTRLGYHEGPKPTPPIVDFLNHGTLLTQLRHQARAVSLLNAFPPRYFETIKAGYRIPGVIALSVKQAGIHLKTMQDLIEGNAMSADFTAEGWREHLGYPNTPVLTHIQAGKRLSILADQSDLTIFEYWLTDLAGHHRDMRSASIMLDTFDKVLGSLLNAWDDKKGLILLTSDHGNLEDLSTRHHTLNDVPLLLIGDTKLRKLFIYYMNISRASRQKFDLTDIAPAILNFIG
jgi:2,3-bisphosphoglycerate-independent phosphoglycerate mutase